MKYRLDEIISEKELNDLLIFKLELELSEYNNENSNVLKEEFNFDRTE